MLQIERECLQITDLTMDLYLEYIKNSKHNNRKTNNSNKNAQKTLHQEDIMKINKHMKRCLTSLAI